MFLFNIYSALLRSRISLKQNKAPEMQCEDLGIEKAHHITPQALQIKAINESDLFESLL